MRTDVARRLHRRTFRALDHDPHDLHQHERLEGYRGARVRGPAR
jgi:hypothetical protein